jgi:hypothetical protein
MAPEWLGFSVFVFRSVSYHCFALKVLALLWLWVGMTVSVPRHCSGK